MKLTTGRVAKEVLLFAVAVLTGDSGAYRRRMIERGVGQWSRATVRLALVIELLAAVGMVVLSASLREPIWLYVAAIPAVLAGISAWRLRSGQ